MPALDTFTNGFATSLFRVLNGRLYVQMFRALFFFIAIVGTILELFIFDILNLYVTGCESIVGDWVASIYTFLCIFDYAIFSLSGLVSLRSRPRLPALSLHLILL